MKIVCACDCLHLEPSRIDSNDHILALFSAHNSFARKTTTEISIYDASWVRRRVQYLQLDETHLLYGAKAIGRNERKMNRIRISWINLNKYIVPSLILLLHLIMHNECICDKWNVVHTTPNIFTFLRLPTACTFYECHSFVSLSSIPCVAGWQTTKQNEDKFAFGISAETISIRTTSITCIVTISCWLILAEEFPITARGHLGFDRLIL